MRRRLYFLTGVFCIIFIVCGGFLDEYVNKVYERLIDTCYGRPPEQLFMITLSNYCPNTLYFGISGPSPIRLPNGALRAEPGQSLAFSLPENWEHTQDHHHGRVVGPRFWARSGCKYDDEDPNKLQCETGDCGNFYDCSGNMLAGKAPATLAEFCFRCGDEYTYYDVSLVDGYSVSVDITPGPDHSPSRPDDPTNPFWCKTNLCTTNRDLRTTCDPNFTLMNKDLPSYNPRDPVTKVACFSNCGKYEYPFAPLINCSDSDLQCKNWRQYCCQSSTYGKSCHSDSQCDDGGACWNGTCQCRAYYRHPPCPSTVCTNPTAQPEPNDCDDCVGDDYLHQVCSRAYTWPNDPQTYSCNSKSYTITFCPGGTTEPITPVSVIPKCSTLDPDIFDWTTAQKDCATSHGNFLCAVRKTEPMNVWACNVDKSGCDTVICRW